MHWMVPFKYCLFFIFWLCHEHNSLQLGPILPSSPCIKELHGFKNMRIKFATADFLGTEQSRVNAFWRNGEEEVGSKLMWVDRTSPRTTTTTKTFWSQIKFFASFSQVQCDQIGRFMEVLGNKLSRKSSPNNLVTFWAISIMSLWCKWCVATFWGKLGNF